MFLLNNNALSRSPNDTPLSGCVIVFAHCSNNVYQSLKFAIRMRATSGMTCLADHLLAIPAYEAK